MNRLRWLLLALSLTAPMAALAEHATLQYRIEGSENTLELVHLAGQTTAYQVVGLPFPGEVLWRPGTAQTEPQLAYRHPTEGSWLLATPSLLPPSPTATVSLPGAPGPHTEGQPTRRWAQRADKEDCGVLFGSAALGQQSGLTLADFQQLYRLLYWLNAAELPTGCGNALTLPNTAPQIGLPTRWASPWGLLVFTGQALPTDAAQPLAWPKLTYPVTPEVQLRLLLVQLPIPARAAFIRENATLPMAEQVAKLAKLLNQLAAQAQ